MRTSTERLLTALGVLAFFVLQFCWLAYSQASWGLSIPFPFTTTLISIVMPIIAGLSAAVLAREKSVSASQRKLLYWIIAASVAEIVTINVMLWFGQPLLLLAVFLLNAFMAVQLLRFGISWFRAETGCQAGQGVIRSGRQALNYVSRPCRRSFEMHNPCLQPSLRQGLISL